jgi:RNA polymerase sigma-70 factor (ECF subfamily)
MARQARLDLRFVSWFEGCALALDAELATRAAGGDRQAAGEIYDRYAPLVRAILLDAAGSQAEANELVQQVFLRALAALRQLRHPERLCGWLVEIARREGTEYRRQAARRRKRFAPLVDEPAARSGEGSEMIDAVRRAICELPERERLAVHIHYLCGEPAEVARGALGLSPSGFYKLLDRARERLRTKLLKTEEKR